MADVSDYINLITSEHADKPDFVATVSLICQAFVDIQNVTASLPDDYDLDQSIGVQEDADGLWIGITRFVPQPLANVYFSWGTENLGWGQGSWRGAFDPVEGLVRLDDETYRLLLKARAIANGWDGTTAGAMPALQELFSGTSTPDVKLFIQDHMDMSMSFVVAGQWPSAVFLSLLATGALGLKPTGVRVNYLKTSIGGLPVFGWGMGNDFVSGWGIGAWAVEIVP